MSPAGLEPLIRARNSREKKIGGSTREAKYESIPEVFLGELYISFKNLLCMLEVNSQTKYKFTY